MKKFEHYCSNLNVLSRAGQEDLTNEFIIGGIIDKFHIQFEGVRLEGRKEGNEEGRVEGEKRKAIAIARNLKSMGMSISDVSKATGLQEEEIKEL